MKRIYTVLALCLMMLLTACGRIETGNVGVRTDFNGTMSTKTEGEGFYTALLGHVTQYSGKEIAIDLENLTPKAKDNLSLAELDMTVYYKAEPGAIRNLAAKRSGQSLEGPKGVFYPAILLVKSVSQSEIADVVSKIDSLMIHTQRDRLQNDAMKAIQNELNKSDPGVFTITRVVVRQVKTDPTIEQSIRNVVAKEKELEAAKLNVSVAEANAKATQQTAMTLTPAFLQHEYNQVMMEAFKSGKVGTVVMDGTSSGKILNLK